ncbi:hypothetical protein AB1Y20_018167 [Prymnesium parvum]|uniref:Uncharacterized protein n=1 Tax=Prymnesium parvum TaxID=97485 RepID=A0AB34JMB9_PRYPA
MHTREELRQTFLHALEARSRRLALASASVIAACGVVFYWNRQQAKERVVEQISDVATLTLGDQKMQAQAQQATMQTLQALLGDQATLQRCVHFLSAVAQHDETRRALIALLVEALKSGAVLHEALELTLWVLDDQRCREHLVGALVSALKSEEFLDGAGYFASLWLERPDVREAVTDCLKDASIRVLEDEAVRRHAETFVMDLVQQPQLQEKTSEHLWAAVRGLVISPKRTKNSEDERRLARSASRLQTTPAGASAAREEGAVGAPPSAGKSAPPASQPAAQSTSIQTQTGAPPAAPPAAPPGAPPGAQTGAPTGAPPASALSAQAVAPDSPAAPPQAQALPPSSTASSSPPTPLSIPPSPITPSSPTIPPSSATPSTPATPSSSATTATPASPASPTTAAPPAPAASLSPHPSPATPESTALPAPALPSLTTVTPPSPPPSPTTAVHIPTPEASLGTVSLRGPQPQADGSPPIAVAAPALSTRGEVLVSTAVAEAPCLPPSLPVAAMPPDATATGAANAEAQSSPPAAIGLAPTDMPPLPIEPSMPTWSHQSEGGAKATLDAALAPLDPMLPRTGERAILAPPPRHRTLTTTHAPLLASIYNLQVEIEKGAHADATQLELEREGRAADHAVVAALSPPDPLDGVAEGKEEAAASAAPKASGVLPDDQPAAPTERPTGGALSVEASEGAASEGAASEDAQGADPEPEQPGADPSEKRRGSIFSLLKIR